MLGKSVPLRLVRAAGCLALAALCQTGAAFAQAGGMDQGPSRPVVQQAPTSDTMNLNAALARLGRDPRDLSALFDAGNAALAIGDVDAANGFFSRADQVSPGNPRVKAGLASALVRSGNPFDAIPLFIQAEAGGGMDSRAALDRGLAYDLVADNAAAQRFYRQALATGSNDEAARRLALSLAITGDRKGSDAVLSPMLMRQDKAAWRTRAFALAIMGQTDEAVAVLNSTLPPSLAGGIAPYLRYMPRLTPAQQAAAANFGQFPRASEIGQDDPRIAALATNRKRPVIAGADASLVPQGEPLGRRERTRESREAQRRREDAEKQRQRDLARAQEAQRRRELAQAEELAKQREQAEQQRRRELARAEDAARRARNNRVVVAPPPPTPAPVPPRPAIAVNTGAINTASPPAARRVDPFAAPAAAAVVPATPAFPAPAPPAAPPAGPGYVLAGPAVASPVYGPAAPVTSDPVPARPALATAVPVPPAYRPPAPALLPPAAAPLPAPVPATIAPVAASPAPAPLQVYTPPPQERRKLADAFKDFSAPAADATPAAGAVDIRRIRPARETEPAQPGTAGRSALERPAAPSHPSRIWVQLATGRDKSGLGFDFRRMAKQGETMFKGKRAYVSAWGQTNRLLTGPFESEAAANGFIAQLRRGNIDGSFVWTSPAGQVVDALAGR